MDSLLVTAQAAQLSMSSPMSAGQIAWFIIGSLIIIFGAYLVTYYVARGSKRMYKGRMINVIDRFSISKDKSILLIEVLDQLYLVAYSAGAITLLDKPDLEAVKSLAQHPLPTDAGPANGLGARVLSHFIGQSKDKLGRPKNTQNSEADLSRLRRSNGKSFEAYLHQDDDLDRVYQRMQSRKVVSKDTDETEEDNLQ